MHRKALDTENDDKAREKAGDAYLLLQELTHQPEQLEFHEFGK